MKANAEELPLTDADERYIRAHFVPVEALCAGRDLTPAELQAAIDAGQLPRAPYVLRDGTPMFPRDELALLDVAGSLVETMAVFERRYRAIAREYGETDTEQNWRDEWASYLEGGYAICLREATPENIFRKERLVRSLTRLLAEAQPEDPTWCERLRQEVDALDVLERPFAPCDRLRFGGPVSRDRLLTAPRNRWPALFGIAAPAMAAD